MLRIPDAGSARAPRTAAPVFSALGNRTRLGLIGSLCRGGALSITELSLGSRMTRQAVTKHLRVLERASLVHGVRRGRRRLFRLSPKPIGGAREYLDFVSRQWEGALARLKDLIESPAPGGTS
jgi:DNA-binding transcriptional ArsR family regulator